MQLQQQISKVFDIAVPLLLYFGWDWDLHFILLFVYIDAISGVLVSFFKEKKIELTRNIELKQAQINLFKYLIFVVLGIALFELSISQIYPDLDLWKSFVDFLLFEEMGIPQFALIIPLVLLLNYQQYQVQFIKSKFYDFFPLNYLRNHNKVTWLLFGIVGLLIFILTALFSWSPLLMLLIFLFLKAVADFVAIPYLTKKITSL